MDLLDGMVVKAQADLPRCPSGAVRLQLMYSAAEFAKRTDCWRKWQHLDVVANTYSYQLASGGTAVVRAVSEVVLGEDENSGYPVSRSDYTLRVSGSDMFLVFRASPGSARTNWIHVRLVMHPARNAPIDDVDWLERWETAIVKHAIYEMARKPRRPWSSFAVSEHAYRNYLRELERAKAEALNIDGGSFNGGVNV